MKVEDAPTGTGERDASDTEVKPANFQDENINTKDKKPKDTTTKTKTQPKEGKLKWRRDWKAWIAENKTVEKFQRADNQVLVNMKESMKIYGINRDDLATLPHCPVSNPHARAFTPSKFFRKAEVESLAFRKEAILAGISRDDEDLLAQGREIYEDRNGYVVVTYARQS